MNNSHLDFSIMNNCQSVYLALGSNLGDPRYYIENAIERIKQIEHTCFIKISPFYRTKPFGGISQEDYLNAVLLIETRLAPLALLDITQSIEHDLGRVRTSERFASRTLDIDILLYGNEVIDNARLTIPHHGLLIREFMLYPLYDIEPTLILPGGQVLADVVAQTDKNGMKLWDI